MSAVDRTLAELESGRISAQVAIARLMLSGHSAEAVTTLLGASLPFGIALRSMERLVQSGVDHGDCSEADAIQLTNAMFDRLVDINPEASVAAYSLGDPVLLEQATEEVVAWMEARGLLSSHASILDLGCGIGRFCSALQPWAGLIVGTESSNAMARAARARTESASIVRGTGRDLSFLVDASFDIVLAVDVFPYLVRASVAEAHIREAFRLLRPGGHLVILNYSYRNSNADIADLLRLADQHDGEVLVSGERPFRHWDGLAFILRRSLR